MSEQSANPQPANPQPTRPIVSSVTGKPMALPQPKPGEVVRENTANDARLRQDVPPHWGK